jgi:hypothetical protein
MPKHNTRKTPLYGNVKVLAIDNTHIFNCGARKAKWYLYHNLADIIQEHPSIIRLNFATKGNGWAGDDYFLQYRENICVVCGTDKKLTRHHIFPYCYRQWLSYEIRTHNSYDVLPLCSTCHDKYEKVADQFKKQIYAEYSVEHMEKAIHNRVLKKVRSNACAIFYYRDKIPDKRYEELLMPIKQHFGKDNIDDKDIKEAMKVQSIIVREDYKPESQLLMEKITDIEAFVRKWRQHFITTLTPQYMPSYWSVDRPFMRKK